MKKFGLLLVICLSICWIGGCGGEEITENVLVKSNKYYSDTVEMSEGNTWNYSKRLITEGLTTPLDLFNGELDELVVSWKSGSGSGSLLEIVSSESMLESGSSLEVTPVYTNEIGFGETIESIKLINLSSEEKSIKYCAENGWFSIKLANYIKCFGIELGEDLEYISGDEVLVSNGERTSVFYKLSEVLGNPTSIFEEEEKEVKNQYYIYEFPDYLIVCNIEDSGEELQPLGIEYISKDLWKGNLNANGLLSVYRKNYIEIVKE